MGYTELYVTQGSGANSNNAGYPLGANDGPILTLTDVTAVFISSGSHTLTNNSGTGWTGVSVGDFLVFDTASNRRWMRVTEIATGGNGNVITAYSMINSNVAAANKAVSVGGAWPLLRNAIVYVGASNATYWPAGVPGPRINVKRHGGNVYADAANLTTSATWTYAIPMCIEGYNTVPGDIDWMTSNDRAVTNYSTNSCTVLFSGNNIYVTNLEFRFASNGTGNTLVQVSNVRNDLKNVKILYSGTVAAMHLCSFSGRAIRCIAERTDPTHQGYGFVVSGTALYCVSIGTGTNGRGYSLGSNGAALYHCLAYGSNIAIAIGSYNQMVVNCTLANSNYGFFMSYPDAVLLNNKVGNCLVGFHSSSATDYRFVDFNEIDECSTNDVQQSTFLCPNNIIGQGPVFANAAGLDFTPHASSPGNDAARPGTYPGTSLVTYMDTGAIQRERTTGAPGGPTEQNIGF